MKQGALTVNVLLFQYLLSGLFFILVFYLSAFLGV